MGRPRLLFLCQTLPFPPDGGVAIRSFNVLRLLSKHYDVAALTFARRAAATDIQASTSALREFATSIDVFPIEQEYSRPRLVRDHLESVIRRRVYTVPAYRSRAFAKRLVGTLESGSFDLVHVDSLDLSGYFPLVGGLPTICTHHNVESALLRRRAAMEAGRMRRGYLRMQAEFMEREERQWLPRMALNVAVSDDDRRELLRLAPSARVSIVPNGVDVDRFVVGAAGSRGIVFVGGMTWFPNRDALEYFARDILPELRALGCSDPVTWVGRTQPGAAESYGERGIDLTGYVDDIRPYVTDAACYIVPLRVGGGTRLKILDAWAMGKAVVSTSIGCEGLDARDGWNILIRNDARGFAAAVQDVLSDSELRGRLGTNARHTAERTYSWDVIGEGLFKDYEAIRHGAVPQSRATTAA